MPVLSLILDVFFVCLCGLFYRIFRNRRKRLLPLPPGLVRWPILGNALSMPLTYAHVYYKRLGNKLGTKFIYLEAMGQPFLIINDYRVAQDLLEKRSALYSSRPQFQMTTEVIGLKRFFILMPYGDGWRNHRRVFRRYFDPKYLPRDQEKQLDFVRKSLLPNLFTAPDEAREHVANCVGSLILSMTYGLPAKTQRDPLVEFAEKTFNDVAVASAPGKYLVNIIPQLKYLPDWFPGTGFKREARDIIREVETMREEPYQATLDAMDEGVYQECFISANVEKLRSAPDFEDRIADVKEVGMVIFTAGFETTTGAIMTFILAMLLNHDVQRQAQSEIDAVLGPERLPTFSDLSDLPYFSAVIKEVLRWNPVVPSGVPHLTTDEDVYDGYYIPKNCIVMSNIYAMLHDEKIFPDPEKFDPGRFIKNGDMANDDLLNPIDVIFGFGRRVCPGSLQAMSMLEITAVSILCIFDIVPALDAQGKPIDVVPEFTPASITSHPLPFKFTLSPRKGKDAEGLLNEYMNVEYV
ncbi:cytochrome P450 [Agaricus bisporus var. bisporus H97]|uniref:cytochrome P450 n=1 Tax=Agaricus bisporus var. bisporus (strain H97 / ATCC MYA-4626 / FGSC 10389) TaxID=936046 RepID=UPI00029F58C3|nr:cytochrome P450 [Agaricus bisporus var. bisporus H97]EKV49426.1 cytochrome P450 [Agaricus bisporus var. bisporus H97]